MEIINRLNSRVARVKPVTLSVSKIGVIRLSEGLLELLNKPDFVEFIIDNNKLYIRKGDDDSGFELRNPKKGYYRILNCIMLVSRFFGSVQHTAVVFTDPVNFDGGLVAYEVKTPAL